MTRHECGQALVQDLIEKLEAVVEEWVGEQASTGFPHEIILNAVPNALIHQAARTLAALVDAMGGNQREALDTAVALLRAGQRRSPPR